MSKAKIQKLIDNAPSNWLRMFARYNLGKRPRVDRLIEVVLEHTPSMRSSGKKGKSIYQVPKSVKKEAWKGLILSWQNNYTSDSGIGLVRGMQLLVKSKINERSVLRMNKYFTNKQRDKESPNFGNDDNPSRGYMAWLNWGGDSGKHWSNEIVGRDQLSKANLRNNPNFISPYFSLDVAERNPEKIFLMENWRYQPNFEVIRGLDVVERNPEIIFLMENWRYQPKFEMIDGKSVEKTYPNLILIPTQISSDEYFNDNGQTYNFASWKKDFKKITNKLKKLAKTNKIVRSQNIPKNRLIMEKKSPLILKELEKGLKPYQTTLDIDRGERLEKVYPNLILIPTQISARSYYDDDRDFASWKEEFDKILDRLSIESKTKDIVRSQNIPHNRISIKQTGPRILEELEKGLDPYQSKEDKRFVEFQTISGSEGQSYLDIQQQKRLEKDAFIELARYVMSSPRKQLVGSGDLSIYDSTIEIPTDLRSKLLKNLLDINSNFFNATFYNSARPRMEQQVYKLLDKDFDFIKPILDEQFQLIEANLQANEKVEIQTRDILQDENHLISNAPKIADYILDKWKNLKQKYVDLTFEAGQRDKAFKETNVITTSQFIPISKISFEVDDETVSLSEVLKQINDFISDRDDQNQAIFKLLSDYFDRSEAFQNSLKSTASLKIQCDEPIFGNLNEYYGGEGNLLGKLLMRLRGIKFYDEGLAGVVVEKPTTKKSDSDYIQRQEQILRDQISEIEYTLEGNFSEFDKCNIVLFVKFGGQLSRGDSFVRFFDLLGLTGFNRVLYNNWWEKLNQNFLKIQSKYFGLKLVDVQRYKDLKIIALDTITRLGVKNQRLIVVGLIENEDKSKRLTQRFLRDYICFENPSDKQSAEKNMRTICYLDHRNVSNRSFNGESLNLFFDRVITDANTLDRYYDGSGDYHFDVVRSKAFAQNFAGLPIVKEYRIEDTYEDESLAFVNSYDYSPIEDKELSENEFIFVHMYPDNPLQVVLQEGYSPDMFIALSNVIPYMSNAYIVREVFDLLFNYQNYDDPEAQEYWNKLSTFLNQAFNFNSVGKVFGDIKFRGMGQDKSDTRIVYLENQFRDTYYGGFTKLHEKFKEKYTQKLFEESEIPENNWSKNPQNKWQDQNDFCNLFCLDIYENQYIGLDTYQGNEKINKTVNRSKFNLDKFKSSMEDYFNYKREYLSGNDVTMVFNFEPYVYFLDDEERLVQNTDFDPVTKMEVLKFLTEKVSEFQYLTIKVVGFGQDNNLSQLSQNFSVEELQKYDLTKNIAVPTEIIGKKKIVGAIGFMSPFYDKIDDDIRVTSKIFTIGEGKIQVPNNSSINDMDIGYFKWPNSVSYPTPLVRDLFTKSKITLIDFDSMDDDEIKALQKLGLEVSEIELFHYPSLRPSNHTQVRNIYKDIFNRFPAAFEDDFGEIIEYGTPRGVFVIYDDGTLSRLNIGKNANKKNEITKFYRCTLPLELFPFDEFICDLYYSILQFKNRIQALKYVLSDKVNITLPGTNQIATKEQIAEYIEIQKNLYLDKRGDPRPEFAARVLIIESDPKITDKSVIENVKNFYKQGGTSKKMTGSSFNLYNRFGKNQNMRINKFLKNKGATDEDISNFGKTPVYLRSKWKQKKVRDYLAYEYPNKCQKEKITTNQGRQKNVWGVFINTKSGWQIKPKKAEGVVREFILPETFELDVDYGNLEETFAPKWMSYEDARKKLNEAYGDFFESVWKSRSQTTLTDIVEQAVQDFDPSTLIGAREKYKKRLERGAEKVSNKVQQNLIKNFNPFLKFMTKEQIKAAADQGITSEAGFAFDYLKLYIDRGNFEANEEILSQWKIQNLTKLSIVEIDEDKGEITSDKFFDARPGKPITKIQVWNMLSNLLKYFSEYDNRDKYNYDKILLPLFRSKIPNKIYRIPQNVFNDRFRSLQDRLKVKQQQSKKKNENFEEFRFIVETDIKNKELRVNQPFYQSSLNNQVYAIDVLPWYQVDPSNPDYDNELADFFIEQGITQKDVGYNVVDRLIKNANFGPEDIITLNRNLNWGIIYTQLGREEKPYNPELFRDNLELNGLLKKFERIPKSGKLKAAIERLIKRRKSIYKMIEFLANRTEGDLIDFSNLSLDYMFGGFKFGRELQIFSLEDVTLKFDQKFSVDELLLVMVFYALLLGNDGVEESFNNALGVALYKDFKTDVGFFQDFYKRPGRIVSQDVPAIMKEVEGKNVSNNPFSIFYVTNELIIPQMQKLFVDSMKIAKNLTSVVKVLDNVRFKINDTALDLFKPQNFTLMIASNKITFDSVFKGIIFLCLFELQADTKVQKRVQEMESGRSALLQLTESKYKDNIDKFDKSFKRACEVFIPRLINNDVSFSEDLNNSGSATLYFTVINEDLRKYLDIYIDALTEVRDKVEVIEESNYRLTDGDILNPDCLNTYNLGRSVFPNLMSLFVYSNLSTYGKEALRRKYFKKKEEDSEIKIYSYPTLTPVILEQMYNQNKAWIDQSRYKVERTYREFFTKYIGFIYQYNFKKLDLVKFKNVIKEVPDDEILELFVTKEKKLGELTFNLQQLKLVSNKNNNQNLIPLYNEVIRQLENIIANFGKTKLQIRDFFEQHKDLDLIYVSTDKMLGAEFVTKKGFVGDNIIGNVIMDIRKEYFKSVQTQDTESAPTRKLGDVERKPKGYYEDLAKRTLENYPWTIRIEIKTGMKFPPETKGEYKEFQKELTRLTNELYNMQDYD